MSKEVFECDQCDKKFGSKGSLTKHTNAVHPKDEVETPPDTIEESKDVKDTDIPEDENDSKDQEPDSNIKDGDSQEEPELVDNSGQADGNRPETDVTEDEPAVRELSNDERGRLEYKVRKVKSAISMSKDAQGKHDLEVELEALNKKLGA